MVPLLILSSGMPSKSLMPSSRVERLDPLRPTEPSAEGWSASAPAYINVSTIAGFNLRKQAEQIKELIDMGYLKQILLSQDIANKTMLVSYGGQGYAHLLREVVPVMKIYGISDEQINTMMVENPKRLLPFASIKE